MTIPTFHPADHPAVYQPDLSVFINRHYNWNILDGYDTKLTWFNQQGHMEQLPIVQTPTPVNDGRLIDRQLEAPLLYPPSVEPHNTLMFPDGWVVHTY
ncbi:MAG: hypothetical protein LBR15_03685 [Methanobrevibacter sp.]|jgi:hypothetical protein|nr:hypothetical protein [Candidatus Methanovirga australis]